MKRIITVLYLILFTSTCYAGTFNEYINSTPKIKQSNEEIKREWKETVGIDVWEPYYRVDKFIARKTALRIWKLRGRLTIEGKKKYNYTFKYNF